MGVWEGGDGSPRVAKGDMDGEGRPKGKGKGEGRVVIDKVVDEGWFFFYFWASWCGFYGMVLMFFFHLL